MTGNELLPGYSSRAAELASPGNGKQEREQPPWSDRLGEGTTDDGSSIPGHSSPVPGERVYLLVGFPLQR